MNYESPHGEAEGMNESVVRDVQRKIGIGRSRNAPLRIMWKRSYFEMTNTGTKLWDLMHYTRREISRKQYTVPVQYFTLMDERQAGSFMLCNS